MADGRIGLALVAIPLTPGPSPIAMGEGSWLRGEAVFLVAFARLDCLDFAVLGVGYEERPREVAIVLREVEGETCGVFEGFLSESRPGRGTFGKRLHGFQQVGLAEGDEGLS